MLGATVAGVTLLRLLSVLYDVTLRKGTSVGAVISRNVRILSHISSSRSSVQAKAVGQVSGQRAAGSAIPSKYAMQSSPVPRTVSVENSRSSSPKLVSTLSSHPDLQRSWELLQLTWVRETLAIFALCSRNFTRIQVQHPYQDSINRLLRW